MFVILQMQIGVRHFSSSGFYQFCSCSFFPFITYISDLVSCLFLVWVDGLVTLEYSKARKVLRNVLRS